MITLVVVGLTVAPLFQRLGPGQSEQRRRRDAERDGGPGSPVQLQIELLEAEPARSRER